MIPFHSIFSKEFNNLQFLIITQKEITKKGELYIIAAFWYWQPPSHRKVF